MCRVRVVMLAPRRAGQSTFFTALDLNADGRVSLKELLTIAMPGADKYEVAKMRAFLDELAARQAAHEQDGGAALATLGLGTRSPLVAYT